MSVEEKVDAVLQLAKDQETRDMRLVLFSWPLGTAVPWWIEESLSKAMAVSTLTMFVSPSLIEQNIFCFHMK